MAKEGEPPAAGVALAELPAPRRLKLPKVNGWYVLAAIGALHGVTVFFELPRVVELPLLAAILGLGVLRFFDPEKPNLPRGWENIWRRRR